TKVVLAATALFLGAALGPPGAPAAPRAAQADPAVEVDVSLFFNSLAPLGEWVRSDPYGWVWVPEGMDYGWRPYTVGYWAWVDPYGWTWVSEEEFGWATYHYGRWTYLEEYGWGWVPGTVWGPSWVAFRYGDPWIGWAPLPPGPGWRI